MQDFKKTIKTLNEWMWDRRINDPLIDTWLNNFSYGDAASIERDRTHALYLLSRFSFFNETLMRALLRSLFRDHIQRPLISAIRSKSGNSTDYTVITPKYERALAKVHYFGVGNPSESGTHLLYYFRQENQLPTENFLSAHELFVGGPRRQRLRPNVGRLVFLDDFCGSGRQAVHKSKDVLERVRSLSKRARLSYYSVFATARGLEKVRSTQLFDDVDAVFELDQTFKALGDDSRYFRGHIEGVTREAARAMCETYGKRLASSSPLGFGNCQLLLGFSHNIPNNTLPIFWSHGNAAMPWTPIFERYRKVMNIEER